ncbi:30S ribosomal protein S17 [Patescibacteria group bacterium]|nr:30S ribosomal protein S17 [Patescibacteria group bacterium]
MIGKVISKKMDNTVVVEVERFVIHPLYKKRLRRKKKYLVEDTLGVVEGDNVSIKATKPISKRKRFKIVEVLK